MRDRLDREGPLPLAEAVRLTHQIASALAHAQVAYGYALAGEDEKAIDWLERAVEQHDQNIPSMGVQPVFRHLRDNPRFRALAQKVGVPLWKGTDVP